MTRPYKREIVRYLDSVTPHAAEAGSANTVLVRDGRLVGLSTDGDGVLLPLRRRIDPSGRAVAILGAGGAARAAAFALVRAGARVDGRRAAGASRPARSRPRPAAPPPGFDELGRLPYDVLVNATPVGSGAIPGESPVAREPAASRAASCSTWSTSRARRRCSPPRAPGAASRSTASRCWWRRRSGSSRPGRASPAPVEAMTEAALDAIAGSRGRGGRGSGLVTARLTQVPPGAQCFVGDGGPASGAASRRAWSPSSRAGTTRRSSRRSSTTPTCSRARRSPRRRTRSWRATGACSRCGPTSPACSRRSRPAGCASARRRCGSTTPARSCATSPCGPAARASSTRWASSTWEATRGPRTPRWWRSRPSASSGSAPGLRAGARPRRASSPGSSRRPGSRPSAPETLRERVESKDPAGVRQVLQGAGVSSGARGGARAAHDARRRPRGARAGGARPSPAARRPRQRSRSCARWRTRSRLPVSAATWPSTWARCAGSTTTPGSCSACSRPTSASRWAAAGATTRCSRASVARCRPSASCWASTAWRCCSSARAGSRPCRWRAPKRSRRPSSAAGSSDAVARRARGARIRFGNGGAR